MEEPPAELRVDVRSVGGEVLTLTLPPGAVAEQLKQALEERWGIPRLCQRLLVGSNVLDDSEALADSCQGAGGLLLEVTLLVTLDQAMASLEEDDEDEKKMTEAFRSLSQFGAQGGEKALAVVVARLFDGVVGPGAYLAGLEALERLAPPGHRAAIAMAVEGIGEESQEVRLAAVRALKQLAENDDEDVIRGVAGHLESVHYHVRCFASETLVQLAAGAGSAGRAVALAAAGERLLDAGAAVRQAAGGALRAMAERGDEQVVALGLRVLESEDGRIRASALEVLAQVCRLGDERVIDATVALLEDEDEAVRFAAVKALRQAAERGDERALAEVHKRVGHGTGYVRQAAVKALGQLGHQGDEWLALELVALLEDDAWVVRQAAVEALGLLAERGSRRLCSEVLARLDHDSDGVRQAAVEAMAQVATVGDIPTIEALSACLHDKQFGVRGAAVKALGRVARKGDERAVAAVRARLEHPKEDVRKAASQALAAVGGRSTLSTIMVTAGKGHLANDVPVASSGPLPPQPATLTLGRPGTNKLRAPPPSALGPRSFAGAVIGAPLGRGR